MLIMLQRVLDYLILHCQDWDRDLSGGITIDQMREIFRIYKVGHCRCAGSAGSAGCAGAAGVTADVLSLC